MVSERLPEYKAYPLLTIIKVLLVLIGCLLIIGSVVGVIIMISVPKEMFKVIDPKIVLDPSFLRVWFAFGFISLAPFGLMFITASEVLSVALNMAENLDRQSIIAFATYQLFATRKEAHDKQANK